MRWLLTLVRRFLPLLRNSTRRHLVGMYSDETNDATRRKPNRERA
jgi:hypothetical protein